MSETPMLAVPDATREAVETLVAKYLRNEDQYRDPAYKEAQCRRDFIDPLFGALGWDVHNERGDAEQYRDVVYEPSQKVGEATKAPDYAFRIGGVRKFYVEAKKPSVRVHEEPSAAYQLRRYAWSAKLPLSILTDFDEFAVYDCRRRPDAADAPAVGRVEFLTCREYLDRLGYLYSTFSPEAIRKGSFDRYVEDKRRHRGTAEVDAAFLAEIEGWREALAKDIANHNKPLDLSVDQLNFAVQATIDRLLFFRIAEDRGVEEYGRLGALVGGKASGRGAGIRGHDPNSGRRELGHVPGFPGIYPGLCRLYEEADAKYNAGLFDFGAKGDTLCPRLTISDKVLKPIIEGLYYPKCPYEFSVLGADILGAVYEQFLGKVIRLTPSGMAKVEEKPEVKKAGGVYYTPRYIVDYIVEHTVGEALKEAGTPEAVAKLRILDPACGSGSFLLGAYDCLLRWHLEYYLKHDPEAHAQPKALAGRVSGPDASRRRRPAAARGDAPLVRLGDEWRLSSAERKRILLNNLYGVDLDPQAVEVTKLNLLLKCMEGDIWPGIARQMKLLHDRVRDRVLPNIDGNIKCGNSLIGQDYFEGRLVVDADEEKRVNAFDWEGEKGFRDIMKAGGFDCVIGNPPYGATLGEAEGGYARTVFETATSGLDTYTLFMERGCAMSRPGGWLAVIVPTGWYSGASFAALRRFLACTTDLCRVVNLPYDVFAAWVDTTVYVARRRAERLAWPRAIECPLLIRTFPKRHRITSMAEFEEGLQTANLTDWFADGDDQYLTYADSGTVRVMQRLRGSGVPLSSVAEVQRGVTPFHLSDRPTHANARPAFDGTVRRYKVERAGLRFVRFDESLAEPKPERFFVGPRLLLRELISRQFRLQAVLVTEDFVTNKSLQSIIARGPGPALAYVLGVLNSRLLSWYFLRVSNIAQRDDFPKIVLKESRALPIRPIDFSDPSDVARHDKMVALVERMLDLHRRLPEAKTRDDRELIERRIAATDAEIDALVYELYGLTGEEIAIVEGTA